MSTITCSGCPSRITTADLVTREPLPTPTKPCTDAPFTIVTNGASSSNMPSGTAKPTDSKPDTTPSAVPVSGASSNKMVGVGALAAAVAAAGYML